MRKRKYSKKNACVDKKVLNEMEAKPQDDNECKGDVSATPQHDKEDGMTKKEDENAIKQVQEVSHRICALQEAQSATDKTLRVQGDEIAQTLQCMNAIRQELKEIKDEALGEIHAIHIQIEQEEHIRDSSYCEIMDRVCNLEVDIRALEAKIKSLSVRFAEYVDFINNDVQRLTLQIENVSQEYKAMNIWQFLAMKMR